MHDFKEPPPPLVWGDDLWKEAVIEACIINCIGWKENDPYDTVRTLCHWEAQVAADPKVNSDIKLMIDSAYQQGLERGLRGSRETLRQAVRMLNDIMKPAPGMESGNRQLARAVFSGDHQRLIQLLLDALRLPELPPEEEPCPPNHDTPATGPAAG